MPNIHPTAFVAPGAVVLGDVTLASESSVWFTAVLRGDMAPISIGEQSNIQDGTIVHVDEGEPCIVGPRVGVGHRVILHGIAAGAVLKEGMVVPPGSLVMGVPGKVVRQVDEELARRIEGTWRHYVGQARRYKGGEL